MKKNRYYEILSTPKVEYLHNVSELLLLPSVGMNLNGFKEAMGKRHFNSIEFLKLLNYRNCYLWWENCEDKWEEEVYLLFQPSKFSLNTYFPKFYTYLEDLPTYLAIYNLDIRTILVVLRTEEKWGSIKKHVVNSNYSMLGSKYANLYFNKEELPYQIIVKSEERRQMLENKCDIYIPKEWELLDPIDKDRETLKMKMIDYEGN